MTAISTSAGVATLPAFEHGHDGLNLAAVMVRIPVEANLHQSAVASGRGLGGRSTDFGRNDGADVATLAGKAMVRFRVVSGVGIDPRQTHPPQSFHDQRPKLVHVWPRTTAGAQRQNEVVFVAHHSQLRKMMINDRFPRACDALTTAHEVAAGAAAFQAGGVDGRGLYASATAEVQSDRRPQNPTHLGHRQQPTRCLLNRREVWHRAEIQQRHQCRMIGQMSHEPPIVRFEKVLQHQASEQLMLRELLRTARMRISR